MPRMLKTKFPCRDCKVPTEVERLRYADKATCPLCSSRRLALSKIHWADERFSRELKKVNGVESEIVPFLIGWLKALEASIEGSRHCLETLDVAHAREVPSLTRSARNRARTAKKYLEELAPFFEELIAEAKSNRPMTLLEGGAELPSEGSAPPALRLLRREESDT